mmetsp:Transcript_3258/g.9140  ORF Transcript_3258/g.9140 Transcript_3258/m.9140 type:complete len:138 (-) Transcript_3258:249-662(-)
MGTRFALAHLCHNGGELLRHSGVESLGCDQNSYATTQTTAEETSNDRGRAQSTTTHVAVHVVLPPNELAKRRLDRLVQGFCALVFEDDTLRHIEFDAAGKVDTILDRPRRLVMMLIMIHRMKRATCCREVLDNSASL